jgi:hypothetical protein
VRVGESQPQESSRARLESGLRNREDVLVSGRLWTCPRCGAKLIGRNMWHSCGRASLDDWERRLGPRGRGLYDRFVQLIAACGEYHVAPAKTRIAFLADVRFAAITSITEERLICSFSLPTPVRSRRIERVDEVVPGWWVHRLRISEVSQLDAQIARWLARSYRLMGLRQRLRRRVASRA